MLLIALGGEGLPDINPTILIRHTQLIRVWLLRALRVILGRFILNPPKTSSSALALANQPLGNGRAGAAGRAQRMNELPRISKFAPENVAHCAYSLLKPVFDI